MASFFETEMDRRHVVSLAIGGLSAAVMGFSVETAYGANSKKKYTITYDYNNNLGTTTKKTYTAASAFKHDKPSRKGWKFQGWFTTPSFKTKSTKIVKGTTGNLTFYAKWSMKDYWTEYLKTRIPEVQAMCDDVKKHGDSLLFVTDFHSGSNDLTSCAAMQEVYEKTTINKFVMGGDVINHDNTKEEAFQTVAEDWTSNMSFAEIWHCRGNHDSNDQGSKSTTGEDMLEDKEVCQLFFPHLLDENGEVIETIPNETTPVPGLMPESNYEGVSYQIMVASHGVCHLMYLPGDHSEDRSKLRAKDERDHTLCYVKDNEEQKIRYIFLDTGHPSPAVMEDEQLFWVERRILELSKDWTVLIFQHQCFESKGMDANGIKIMRALDAVYDQSEATIIGVVCGHVHEDFAYKNPKGYMMISSVSDAAGKMRAPEKTMVPRGDGILQQAFDVIHINTKKRTLYFQRLGYGDDRYFTY